MLASPDQAPKPATVEDASDEDVPRDSAMPSSAAPSVPPLVPDDGELKLPSAPGYGNEPDPSPAAQPGYFDPPPTLPSPISPPSHTPVNYGSNSNAPSAPDNWAPTPPPASSAFSPPPGPSAPATGPPTFAPSYSPTVAVAPPPVSPPSKPNVSRPIAPPPNNPAYSHPAPAAPGGFSQVPHQVAGNFTVDDAAMSQAQKHARWAISALNFEDVPTAVRELRRALESLNAT